MFYQIPVDLQVPPTSRQGISWYGGLIVVVVGFFVVVVAFVVVGFFVVVVPPNLAVEVPNMSHVQTNLRFFKAA
jgi:hypothetical protein